MENKNRIKIIIFWGIILGIFIFGIFMNALKNKTLTAIIVISCILIVYTLIIKKLNLSKTKGDKIIEQAIKDGTIIKAKRIGKITYYHADLDSKNVYLRSDRYGAKYEYIVNGKKYKYKCTFVEHIPDNEIELYYQLNNPRKAISSSNEITGASYKIFMLIIPIILALIILQAFGIIDVKNLIS